MKSLRYILICLMVAMAAFLAVFSCSPSASEREIITVSIEPQRFILEQITGDRYDIRTLLANGGDPESYDPTFANLLNTERSAAFMAIGNIGFEQAVIGKIHNSTPELRIYNTSDSITFITGTHGTDEEIDPHTWASIANARIIARNMARAVCEIDPNHASTYMQNLQAFEQRLDSLDNEARRRLAKHRGEAFLVWHPSLSYFARDYGLHQVVVGGPEHKELTPQLLAARLDTARAHQARIFFVQKDMDGRRADAVLRDIDVKRVDFNTLSYDWFEQMGALIDALTENDKP